MYCTHCGRENPDNAKFCSFCGRAIRIPPEETLKKPNRLWIAVLAAVCVLIAAAAVYYEFVFSRTDASSLSPLDDSASASSIQTASGSEKANPGTPVPSAAAYAAPEYVVTLSNSLNMDAEPKLVSGDFNSDGFDDVAILWMT